MKHEITIVRFEARELLRLAEHARVNRLEGLWFVRDKSCRFQAPREDATVEPSEVVGDEMMTIAPGSIPRVEVIDLHNHVIKALVSMADIEDNTFVEVHVTEDDEFRLVLCRGFRGIHDPEGDKPMRWMSNVGMGRLF